jgi:hypothetical protein
VQCNIYLNNVYDWFIKDYSTICNQFTSLAPDIAAGNTFSQPSTPCLEPNNICNLGGNFSYYSDAIICTTPNVNIVPSISVNCNIPSPCDYYDYLTYYDPGDPSIPDATTDNTKIIFNKIYNADYIGATEMINELNIETQANLITLLNLSKDVFYNGRNFWQLDSTETSYLILLACNDDEAGIYAQNILSFYQDSIFSREEIIIEEQQQMMPTLTSLSDEKVNNSFSITPNPSEESFSIKFKTNDSKNYYSITIYDALGKNKKEISLKSNDGIVNLNNCDIGESGLYLIIFREGTDIIYSKKLIIE